MRSLLEGEYFEGELPQINVWLKTTFLLRLLSSRKERFPPGLSISSNELLDGTGACPILCGYGGYEASSWELIFFE